MLSAAVGNLADRGADVSQLSRRGEATHALARGYACNWDVVETVRQAARLAMRDFGPPHAALIWSHSFGTAIPLLRDLSSPNTPLPVFHVLGSAVSNPARYDELRKMRATCEMIDGIQWHAICLGFVIEETQSRWLTHDEISAGVLEAIDAAAPLRTVGVTRPWNKHPSNTYTAP